jgi:hypothetical protein
MSAYNLSSSFLRLPLLSHSRTKVVNKVRIARTLCGIAALVSGALSCGSDSNSLGGAGGAAFVRISTQPRDFDVGDSTSTSVRVEDIKESGIILKIRYPSAAEYVRGSSSVEVNGRDRAREPDRIVSDRDNNRRYLLYFIYPEQIGNERDTTVSFELRGVSRITKGKIEVDPDVASRDIPDQQEFTIANPEFSSEAEVEIEVTGAVDESV